jgi:hypothetical protein
MLDRLGIRVWDKKFHVMHYRGITEEIAATFVKTPCDKKFYAKRWSMLAINCLFGLEEFYREQEFQDRFIVMQRPGLKDSNGKLIHEGDITQRNEDKFEVVYNEKARWYFRYISNDPASYLQDDEIKEYKSYKIIGNIYENPELLNKTV